MKASVLPICFSPYAVVRDDQQRILLLRRDSASKANPLRWDLPGGKPEPGETLDQALLRECLEETGLSVALTGAYGVTEFELSDRRVICVVLQGVVDRSAVTISAEHDAFNWATPETLLEHDLCPHVRRMFERELARPQINALKAI